MKAEYSVGSPFDEVRSPMKNGIDFLKNEEAGLEEIARLDKQFSGLLVVDFPALVEKITARVSPRTFEGWEQREKDANLEALGRLMVGLSCSMSDSDTWNVQVLGESRRLAHMLRSHHAAAVTDLLRLGVLLGAIKQQRGITGGLGDGIKDILSAILKAYENEADAQQVKHLLLNPYGLRMGTELYSNDGKDGIRKFTLEEVDVAQPGAVIIDGEIHNLDDFNGDVAVGRYMLKSGDNVYGGMDLLRQRTVEKYKVGIVLTIQEAPLSHTTMQVKVVATNQKELEEVYENAYVPFVTQLLTLDLETTDGKIHVHYPLKQVRFPHGMDEERKM